MADKIVLNTPRFKGEYPFDLEDEPLTSLEWQWIKKISEYLPLTIGQGWEGGDPSLFVAFAVVALARAGRIQESEALAVAEQLKKFPAFGDAISFVGEEVAEESDPPVPVETPATEQPMRSTGSSSSPISDPLAPGRSLTGRLESVRSAT